MGGLMGGSTPAPLPTPARPVTAVTKTPELELDDTDVQTAAAKKKKGKRALRTDVTTTQMTGSVPQAGAGLQIPKGQ
jgi:hypothetical protein